MSDLNYRHEFEPNRKGLCKMIIGSRNAHICHLPEDAPVHTRQVEADKAAAPQSDQPKIGGTIGLDGDTRRCCNHPGCCNDWPCKLHPQSDQPAQGERKQIEILRRWLFTVGVDEQSKRAEQLMALLKREGIVAAPASRPIAPAQPERSAIDEANSILYPNRTPSSGADAIHAAKKFFQSIPTYSNTAREIDRLAALLESFRAETLERAAQAVDAGETKWKEGDCREEDCGCVTEWIKKEIRALSPDPNWLARQIAEAELEEAKQWHAILRKEVPHVEGDTFECCALISALESTKSNLAPTSKKE